MTEKFISVPDDLKSVPRWVVRRGKIPYNPKTGGTAKAGIPSTWGTFDEAVTACETGQYDGIGFEFVANDGFVGIDLDHVIDPQSKNILKWAQDIVEQLDSYTEYSPSGTGLHIFVRGAIPQDGRKKTINKATGEAIEMYQSKRYFTITGKPFRAAPICDRREEIGSLYERLFVEQNQAQRVNKAPFSAPEYLQTGLKKDTRLVELWNGHRATTDESGNDLALLNKLAYWCNKDEARMIEAFLRSPYAAQKDAEHRKKLQRDDYLHRTAQVAISGCTSTAEEDDRTYNGKKSVPNRMEQYRGATLTMTAVEEALTEQGISIRYNILLKENEIRGLPEVFSSENALNTLPVFLVDYLKTFGIKGVRREIVVDYLNCIADKNRYNPVLEYLNKGEWDGVDRLAYIYRILGVCDDKYRVYIRKWLIQCVALALNDENAPIGAEGVLVLQGEQGAGKTSFFRMLSPFPRWFVEGAVIDVTNKDTIIKALSSWITELGELDSTLKREQSALKAFITATEDRIRAPYARAATRGARRTSFCGTVNPKDYLRDDTGSRRFWTIPIERVDKKTLFSLSSEWVRQLWYQIYSLYQQDKNGFRLTDSEMKQLQLDNREFDMPLPFEEEVMAMLNHSLPLEKWEWWSAAAVAKRVSGYPTARQVGKVLAKFARGCVYRGSNPMPPNPPKYIKYTRILHGTTEYLLPLVHWGVSRVY